MTEITPTVAELHRICLLHGCKLEYKVYNAMSHMVYATAVISKSTLSPYNKVASINSVVGNYKFDPYTGQLSKILAPQMRPLITSKSSNYAKQAALSGGGNDIYAVE